MIKLKKKFKECNTCDYRYEKGAVSGCVFPNHAPIDTLPLCECNTGEVDHEIEVDEDYVLIKNVVEMRIL